jgi:hypothetical protein
LDKCLSTYIAFVGGGNDVFETYLSGEGIWPLKSLQFK